MEYFVTKLESHLLEQIRIYSLLFNSKPVPLAFEILNI